MHTHHTLLVACCTHHMLLVAFGAHQTFAGTIGVCACLVNEYTCTMLARVLFVLTLTIVELLRVHVSLINAIARECGCYRLLLPVMAVRCGCSLTGFLGLL